VVICWIEGGWGSFFSYFKGNPTRNKRMDIWRRIAIAVGPCRILAPEVLEDHRATRAYLMRECLQTRRYLGLDPLSLESANGAGKPASDEPGALATGGGISDQ
jgi:hypothetical protein